MAERISQNEVLFFDSSFAIALVNVRDSLHDAATQIGAEVRSQNCRIYTTRAVLLEIGNNLSGVRNRSLGSQLLRSIARDPSFLVIELTREIYEAGLAFFENRADQDWGLVDCISFEVMRQLGIYRALTADHHFVQAGFETLL